VLQHRAQVLEVEQQQPLVVGDLEHEAEHACLRLVQAEHAPEKKRPHVGHGRAHRQPALAVDVPERHGARREIRFDFQSSKSFQHLGVGAARLADAGEIALHVGHEDRHADRRKPVRERLHGDGLAGAGGAGDQAVAIGQRRQQRKLDFFVLGQKHA
jgi:hypothetical protein